MVVCPLGSPWRLKGLFMAQHPPPNRFLLWVDPSTRAAWEGWAVGGGGADTCQLCSGLNIPGSLL